VSKWSYGYSRFSFAPLRFGPEGRVFASKPKRGDVIVFRPEYEPGRDYVKRLVGLPGDRIQMRDGILHINDEKVQMQHLGKTPFREKGGYVQDVDTYLETLTNGVSYKVFDRDVMGPYDNTPVYEVPAGHYFMMGDDRDNSSDSRAEVQFVPFDHFVGKAEFVFVSFNHSTNLVKPWTLFTGFRPSRFLRGVE
jgi:signal peptidase I